MNEKRMYITKEQGKEMKFPPDLRQCFAHESSLPKTLPEYVLVKTFTDMTEYEKQVTLEVLKFLFQFTFATREQLARMLDQKGLDASGLDDLISKMLDDREMNSFYLNQFATSDPAPEDAYIIYCMDFGALFILKHFSSCDWATWFTTDAMRSSQLIQKYLSTVEFYLSLADARGGSLRYFKPIFDVSFGHMDIRFSASFEIMQGFTAHPFLLESVRSYDLPANWRDKVDEKILRFVNQEKNWGKYFPAPGPVYIFLCETEKDALEAADIYWRRVGIDNFRVTTDEQVRAGFAKAKFWKYVPNTDNSVGTLKAVRSTILSGSEKD